MTQIRRSLRDFHPGETIKIGSATYAFLTKNEERSHKILYEPGAQAIVAKIQRQDKYFFALKSFKKAYRKPAILERSILVSNLADIPGMQAARIEVVDPNAKQYAETVSEYPFLEYAVIMPWLSGRTWSALRYLYKTQDQEHALPNFSICRERAISFAKLLNSLHKQTPSVVHCDICPRNVFINGGNEAALIDFENIFSNTLQPPPWNYPAGQDGYRHHAVSTRREKQWGPHGDLFGGALLIAELLTWHDPEVREQSNDEYYVLQEELHNTNIEPYRILLKSLERISKECSDLFSQAWTGKRLEDCPTMDAWVSILTGLPETLTIPSRTTGPVIKRVPKQQKETIKTSPVDPIPRTTPPKSQAHKSEHVVTRKKVQHRRDQQSVSPSQISEHVSRRIPPDEVKARRARPLDTKQVSPQKPALPPTTTPQPSLQQGQTSPSGSLADLIIGIFIIVFIIAVIIGGCAFLSYLFF